MHTRTAKSAGEKRKNPNIMNGGDGGIILVEPAADGLLTSVQREQKHILISLVDQEGEKNCKYIPR